MVFLSDEVVILFHSKKGKGPCQISFEEGGRAAFHLGLTLFHFHMLLAITARSMFKADAHIPFFFLVI